MEYKLVLEEHMSVLSMKTKHCQVVGGFWCDSCIHRTTRVLMHLNFDSELQDFSTVVGTGLFL